MYISLSIYHVCVYMYISLSIYLPIYLPTYLPTSYISQVNRLKTDLASCLP